MPRQKKPIDEKKVAKLASEGASNREIADILGCDHKTVASRFSPILRKKRAERRMELRRAQWTAVKKGNSALLIWLGKQELDQVDKVAPAAPGGAFTVTIVRPSGVTADATPET